VTLLHSIDFTAGPAGGNVTAANTPGINGSQTGTNPTFDASIPPGQAEAYSAEVDLASGSGSFNNATFTAQTDGLWIGGYIQLTALPAAATYWLLWWASGGSKVGDARINTDGSIGLRDLNTAVATSPALAVGPWHRFATYCDPGSTIGHRLKLYIGDNRHGDIADFDGSGAATSAGLSDVAGFRFGSFITTADARYRISRLRIGTTEADLAPITPPLSSTDYWLDSSGLWRPLTEKYLNGAGTWV
jgi:hypothetical protein